MLRRRPTMAAEQLCQWPKQAKTVQHRPPPPLRTKHKTTQRYRSTCEHLRSSAPWDWPVAQFPGQLRLIRSVASPAVQLTLPPNPNAQRGQINREEGGGLSMRRKTSRQAEEHSQIIHLLSFHFHLPLTHRCASTHRQPRHNILIDTTLRMASPLDMVRCELPLTRANIPPFAERDEPQMLGLREVLSSNDITANPGCISDSAGSEHAILEIKKIKLLCVFSTFKPTYPADSKQSEASFFTLVLWCDSSHGI